MCTSTRATFRRPNDPWRLKRFTFTIFYDYIRIYTYDDRREPPPTRGVLHAWRHHAAGETRAATTLRRAVMRIRNVKCAAAFAAWAAFGRNAKRHAAVTSRAARRLTHRSTALAFERWFEAAAQTMETRRAAIRVARRMMHVRSHQARSAFPPPAPTGLFFLPFPCTCRVHFFSFFFLLPPRIARPQILFAFKRVQRRTMGQIERSSRLSSVQTVAHPTDWRFNAGAKPRTRPRG